MEDEVRRIAGGGWQTREPAVTGLPAHHPAYQQQQQQPQQAVQLVQPVQQPPVSHQPVYQLPQAASSSPAPDDDLDVLLAGAIDGTVTMEQVEARIAAQAAAASQSPSQSPSAAAAAIEGNATTARGANFMDRMAAVNMEEVYSEPVKVTFMEWERVPVRDDDGHVVINPETGQARMRRVKRPRTVLLDTYVPSAIFNHVMAVQQRASREGVGGYRLEVMAECVLPVWQLTEEDMTLERLTHGLTFAQMGALFSRFFAASIRQLTSNPSGGGATI